MRLTIFCLSILFITSCATLSSDECQNADWYIIGLEDGSRGYAITRLRDHRKACAKHNITPNLDRYKAGLSEGYKTYCTRTNGYDMGAAGNKRSTVCTGSLERNFIQAYNLGHKRFEITSAINHLGDQIQNAHNAIDESEEDTRYQEDQLVHHARTIDKKREHLNAIRENNNVIKNNENFIYDANLEHEKLLYDLQQLEKKHKSMGY